MQGGGKEPHPSVSPRGVTFTSHLYREGFPSGSITTVKINADAYARRTPHCIYKTGTTFQEGRHEAGALQATQHHLSHNQDHQQPKNQGQSLLRARLRGAVRAASGRSLCTHRSSGSGGWQRSSSATAEGAPEAPRHGASSINPHGALRWSGHDITLRREHTP